MPPSRSCPGCHPDLGQWRPPPVFAAADGRAAGGGVDAHSSLGCLLAVVLVAIGIDVDALLLLRSISSGTAPYGASITVIADADAALQGAGIARRVDICRLCVPTSRRAPDVIGPDLALVRRLRFVVALTLAGWLLVRWDFLTGSRTVKGSLLRF